MSNHWNAADYAPTVTGEGALKLAASAVAPLVAYTQGVASITGSNVAAYLKRIGRDGRTGRMVTGACSTGDALAMPWSTPHDVGHYWTGRESCRAMGMPPLEVPVSSHQIKPNSSSLRVDKKGRPTGKYLVLSESPSVLGVHPATPPAWLAKTPPVIWVAEGMLKALSLLTALLLDAGVDPDDLRLVDGENPHTARDRLRTLMEEIEPHEAFLVVSLVGVGNWHQNPEWTLIDTRGRDVIVAVDGDVETNPAVARQAGLMHEFLTGGSRAASPVLLRLNQTAGYQPKDGVDDVLARGVTLADIRATATTDFPPPNPPGVDGRWRMNPSTLTCQKFEPDEANGGGHWVDAYPYVARVAEVIRPRFVTDDERNTGKLVHADNLPADASTVAVEFSWYDRSGEVHTRTLIGNQNMLWVPVNKWATSTAVSVIMPTEAIGPDPLAFPPTHTEFLGAMLGYRPGDQINRVAWEQMGWLPTADGEPVFVMGESACGADGETVDPNLAGLAITDSVMAGWQNFGFIVPTDDDEAREAFRAVFDAYFPADPDHWVWTDTRHTAVVMAAALRPVVPIPCRAPVYLTGGTNLGKSYTAAAIMAFWQPRPGTWSSDHLPGSAQDTRAATEMLVARTPIWVTDDVSPNGHDKAAQQRMEGAVDDMMRAVSNGFGKRRATASMGAAKVFKPIALLIVNAEQPTETPSILNRVVHVRVAPGFLNPSRVPTDHLDRISREQGLQAVVTGAAIQYLCKRIRKEGWPVILDEMRDRIILNAEAIARQSSKAGGGQRSSGLLGDLQMGIELWDMLCRHLGLLGEFHSRMTRLYDAFNDIANEGLQLVRTTSLGTSFLAGLQAVLSAHRAHVGVAGEPGAPIPAGTGPWRSRANVLNDLLGWTNGPDGPRPGGERIGTLVWRRDEPYVVFERLAAHRAVTSWSATGLAGHRPNPVWEAIHREGFSATHWAAKQQGNGTPSVMQRVTVDGIVLTGIAIPVSTLVGVTDSEHNEAATG